jgi:thiamine monophosphate synthase
VKKGRHRRFEEARKLKQSGPDFLFAGSEVETKTDDEPEEDDYAAIARKYGAFDDETETDDDEAGE